MSPCLSLKSFCAVLFAFMASQQTLAQNTAFSQILKEAQHRQLRQVSTSAGDMPVLLLWGEQVPALAFVYASGGNGHVSLAQDEQGTPTTFQPNHPAFGLGVPFLQRQVGWVTFGLPQQIGHSISLDERAQTLHIDAVASLGSYLKATYPNTLFVLLGHSNGGVTAGMQAVRDQASFDAVVMSAPNLGGLPLRWKSAQSRIPMLFITHEEDDCRGTPAYKTVHAAKSGDKPLVLIRSVSMGDRTECFKRPAPHFYSGAEDAFADALVNWGRSL